MYTYITVNNNGEKTLILIKIINHKLVVTWQRSSLSDADLYLEKYLKSSENTVSVLTKMFWVFLKF